MLYYAVVNEAFLQCLG